jgi:hypothetical protein
MPLLCVVVPMTCDAGGDRLMLAGFGLGFAVSAILLGQIVY